MVGSKVILKGRIRRLTPQNGAPFNNRKTSSTSSGVLKMLAVMDTAATAVGKSNGDGTHSITTSKSSHSDPPVEDFLSSGRTGRRNALPDILGQHAVITSSDLPNRLQALTTKDQTSPSLSPSSSSSSSKTINESQPGPSSSNS